MKIAVCIIISVLLVSSVKAQNVNVNCNYVFVGTEYTCELMGLLVPDNEQANFIIGGQHFHGHGNNDVRRIQIIFADIPFIIAQLFVTFPGVSAVYIWRGGLRRIQPQAFINARNVREIGMSNNPIEVINENAFNGLHEVRQLFIENNEIRNLHFSSFQGMPALERLHCTGNQLEQLDGRLIANNLLLEQMSFDGNQINFIQRSFLDNQPRLTALDLRGNRCVDRRWSLSGTNATTIENIRQDLSSCFDNFDNREESGTFKLQLRGTMRILYANGTEIVRL